MCICAAELARRYSRRPSEGVPPSRCTLNCSSALRCMSDFALSSKLSANLSRSSGLVILRIGILSPPAWPCRCWPHVTLSGPMAGGCEAGASAGAGGRIAANRARNSRGSQEVRQQSAFLYGFSDWPAARRADLFCAPSRFRLCSWVVVLVLCVSLAVCLASFTWRIDGRCRFSSRPILLMDTRHRVQVQRSRLMRSAREAQAGLPAVGALPLACRPNQNPLRHSCCLGCSPHSA